MRYDKHSTDYHVNMLAFHEMDGCVPMTKPERDSLRNWVSKGYDLDTNCKSYDLQLFIYAKLHTKNITA